MEEEEEDDWDWCRYQVQARMPARTVARRKESYHARSRRPPRGEETTIYYINIVRLWLPRHNRIFDTE